MAPIVKLHPKVREKTVPQMSAASLAEYLIMRTDQQETVLHNARYSSPPGVIAYAGAIRAIQAYCSDTRRPQSLLDSALSELSRSTSDQSIRPKAREESLRCIETIELFRRAEQNAFGLGRLPLVEAPRLALLEVEGVRLSVQPHLLVRQEVKGNSKVGVVFFRPQKAPDVNDCRLEETKRQRGEHRRELARYMLAMGQMTVEVAADLGTFDRATSFVADVRLGERIEFSTTDHAARVRAIKAACKQIRTLWAEITPRTSVLAKE